MNSLTNFPLKKRLDQKYFLFDFETGGLNLGLERPWQVGYGVFSLRNGCEWTREEWLDVPDFQISEEAARQTKFDRNIYNAKKKDGKAALEHFDGYFYDPQYIKLGANIAGFDIMIHANWRQQHGLKPDYSYLKDILDIVMLNRGIKIGKKILPGDSFSAYNLSMVDQRSRKIKAGIDAACKEFGIKIDPFRRHNSAVYDLELTWDIYKNLIVQLDI